MIRQLFCIYIFSSFVIGMITSSESNKTEPETIKLIKSMTLSEPNCGNNTDVAQYIYKTEFDYDKNNQLIIMKTEFSLENSSDEIITTESMIIDIAHAENKTTQNVQKIDKIRNPTTSSSNHTLKDGLAVFGSDDIGEYEFKVDYYNHFISKIKRHTFT